METRRFSKIGEKKQVCGREFRNKGPRGSRRRRFQNKNHPFHFTHSTRVGRRRRKIEKRREKKRGEWGLFWVGGDAEHARQSLACLRFHVNSLMDMQG